MTQQFHQRPVSNSCQALRVTRVPVIIGKGIPLFGPVRRDVRLEHIVTRSYPSGLVTTEYAVADDGQ